MGVYGGNDRNIAPTYMLQTQHLHHPTGVISVSIVVSRFSAGSLS